MLYCVVLCRPILRSWNGGKSADTRYGLWVIENMALLEDDCNLLAGKDKNKTVRDFDLIIVDFPIFLLLDLSILF